MEQDAPMHVDGAEWIVAIHAIARIDVGNTEAVGNLIVMQTAGDQGPPANQAERAAFGQQTAACPAAAFIGNYIDDASDRVRAIERGTGTAQDFHAARVREK